MIFAIFGAGFVVADFVTTLISLYMVGDASSNAVFVFINFAIMCLVCFYLLNGNLTNSYSAFRGMLMFVFLITFGFAENVLYDLPYYIADIIAFDPIAIIVFLLTVGAVVIGVLAYIKTRQYLFMRKGTYKTVFIFNLLFTICSVFASGFVFAIPFLLSTGGEALVLDYSALGDIFLALSMFCTVTRLNPRYD